QVCRQTRSIIEQDLQQMFGCEALMIAAQREVLRRLDESTRALGEPFEIHIVPSTGRAQNQMVERAARDRRCSRSMTSARIWECSRRRQEPRPSRAALPAPTG